MWHNNPIWRQKWPPTPPNDRKSITIDSNLMILMSIPRLWGQGTHITELLNHYEIELMTFRCPLSPNAQTHLFHRISFRAFSFECHPTPQYRPLECCLDCHSFQSGKGHMQQCRGVHSICSCIDRICIPRTDAMDNFQEFVRRHNWN